MALRTVLVAVLVVVAGLAVERGWMLLREAWQPTGDAEWIWIRNTTRWTGPQAFYAVRDFELDVVPSRARVVVLGDEEYVVLLNGRRLGSNRYIAGAPLDEYQVGHLLTEGTNRFTAHLRSSKGQGAFLLALYLDDGKGPIVDTGNDWMIVRRWSPKLFKPWQPIERRERAVFVAHPPVGRWGGTAHVEARPLHEELAPRTRAVRALRWSAGQRDWRPMSARRSNDPRPLGEVVLIDWGQPVTGYATLRFVGSEVPLGLAYFGLRVPDPVRQQPDAYVIGTPGQPYWEDVVPRAFRYVLLVGLGQVTDARVVPTDPQLLRPTPAGEPPPGVFGLPTPRLRSPIEDEIWRELERFARQSER